MIPAPRTAPDDLPDGLPDRALADAARAGDRDAFAELYRRHNKAVIDFIRFRTMGLGVAEDIAGETWLRAARNIERLDAWTDSGFIGWVMTIARNLIVDLFKSGRYRREYLGGSAWTDIEEFQNLRRMYVQDDIGAQLETEVVVGMVRDALEQLNPHQRACIIARYFDELSVSQTAERLGLDLGATKSLQFRAIRTLARVLGTDPRITTEQPA